MNSKLVIVLGFVIVLRRFVPPMNTSSLELMAEVMIGNKQSCDVAHCGICYRKMIAS